MRRVWSEWATEPHLARLPCCVIFYSWTAVFDRDVKLWHCRLHVSRVGFEWPRRARRRHRKKTEWRVLLQNWKLTGCWPAKNKTC